MTTRRPLHGRFHTLLLLAMILLMVPIFLKFCFANDLEVCYPQVVRHRIDSLFPTSQLFCVSKQNDDIQYDDVELLKSSKQWNDITNDWWQTDFPDKDDHSKSLHYKNASGVHLFKLPAAISESDYCTGTQSIMIRRNMTVKCKPFPIENMLAQCTDKSVLSASSFLADGGFIEVSENRTRTIPWLKPVQIKTPVWRNSMCSGVLRSINIVFRMNETIIISVDVDVQYESLSVSANWLEQKFSIQWILIDLATNIEPETNRTTLVGYNIGDQIYRVKASLPVPFNVPALGECNSESVSSSSVMFLRPMSSICTIPTSSCEDARAKARAFYEQVYPAELFSAPSEDTKVTVGRINVTWEDPSPSTSFCRLPVSSVLQIYYSKQGSSKNFREVIVAGKTHLALDDIVYHPGYLIRMPISVSFTDVTGPPKHIFAALPYIDIRLPQDFFYPFVNTASLLCSINICYTVIILCFLYLL